jgi:hypothetical protein
MDPLRHVACIVSMLYEYILADDNLFFDLMA